MRVCVERDIEIDICDCCNSVWLDGGELTKLTKSEEGCGCSWSIPANQELAQTELLCARCLDTQLVKVVVNHHFFQGCRICKGLFIDSAVLDAISTTDDGQDESTSMTSIAGGILDALLVLLA
jgi:Zn-finger nucleic acid-binding protein